MSRPSNLSNARKIRWIYEKRPYPDVEDRVLRDKHWRLAPIKWMNALWQTGREKSQPGRILVAGCGTGREAFQMSRRFPKAEIVAVDFSPRSISIAKRLQQRAPETRNIRFLVADLASATLGPKAGRDFDFVSCHGVLSYIPAPARTLRNLARCLRSDGALYLGVNGVRHFSKSWREILPQFEFDVTELCDGPHLRRLLRMCDVISDHRGNERVSKRPACYLAGDLFGPLIQNLSMADWVRMAQMAGLHFQGSFGAYRALRPALEGFHQLLFPRSRTYLCELVETLVPSEFHRLLFTRCSVVNPPWENPRELLTWRPVLTSLFTVRLPRHSRSGQQLQTVTMESPAANTRVEWRMPGWEIEILRKSTGDYPLQEILRRIPVSAPSGLLQRQLYLLHQFMVINLVP